MSRSRIRLAALYSHPIQYFDGLLKTLSALEDVELTVYFLSDQGIRKSFDPDFNCSFRWDTQLLDGYQHHFLPNLMSTTEVRGFFSLMNVSVVRELTANRYDAIVVHGYEHAAKWFAFLAAMISKTRIILRGDAHLIQPRSMLRRALKRIILEQLFRRIGGFAYVGTLNRQYYESYGALSERLYFSPYAVDNQFFAEAAMKRSASRSELRRAVGIGDDSPVLIQAGKLIELKRPFLMLRAYGEVRKRHKCHLLFVGDGPLRNALTAEAVTLGIPDVHITGFVNQSRMPEMYSLGDVLAVPSEKEQWGLVVNEAMACGLPVIVSDRVGCAPDLVKHGENGFIFPLDNPTLFSQYVERLVADHALRETFGAESRRHIEGFSLDRAAEGILRAARGSLPPVED